MAVSTICDIIPQLISFKQYTMCGPWVYSNHFTKYTYVVFLTGVKGLK